MGGQRHALAVLPPGKKPGTHRTRATGRPQGRCGRVWKISPPQEFHLRTVQPVASRYTDRAIQAHRLLFKP